MSIPKVVDTIALVAARWLIGDLEVHVDQPAPISSMLPDSAYDYHTKIKAFNAMISKVGGALSFSAHRSAEGVLYAVVCDASSICDVHLVLEIAGFGCIADRGATVDPNHVDVNALQEQVTKAAEKRFLDYCTVLAMSSGSSLVKDQSITQVARPATSEYELVSNWNDGAGPGASTLH